MSFFQSNAWRNVRKVRRDVVHRIAGVPWMEVREEDRFLFSYPRSGNTWLRHIIMHLRHSSLAHDFEELENSIPTIDTLEFNERLAKMPSGMRFFKSHLPHEPYFLTGKVVYVVRDGRDVLLSNHDYYRHIKGYKGDLDQFLDKFLTGWMRYGNWPKNVQSWLAHIDHPNLLLVKYEDMRANPLKAVRSICAFTDLAATEDQIQAALDASSVDKVHSTMRSWNLAQGTQFTGGASAGGKKTWRDKLSSEQNDKFVAQAGDLLEALDYPLA